MIPRQTSAPTMLSVRGMRNSGRKSVLAQLSIAQLRFKKP